MTVAPRATAGQRQHCRPAPAKTHRVEPTRADPGVDGECACGLRVGLPESRGPAVVPIGVATHRRGVMAMTRALRSLCLLAAVAVIPAACKPKSTASGDRTEILIGATL